MPEQVPTRKAKRSRTGTVESVSGDKTVGVVVSTLVKHPRYGKYIRKWTKFAVHDPSGAAGAGDLVEIVPCRRISRMKSWRLVRVLRASTKSH